MAAAADVPLGSMSYHFTGMHELLHEAFTRFSHSVSDQLEHRMADVTDRESALRAVTESITTDIFSSQRDLVLTLELYTLAARDPAYRDITNAWMARSRQVLERHFDPATARVLDALVEGLTIHRALDLEPHDKAIAARAIRSMAETEDPFAG